MMTICRAYGLTAYGLTGSPLDHIWCPRNAAAVQAAAGTVIEAAFKIALVKEQAVRGEAGKLQRIYAPTETVPPMGRSAWR